LDVLHAISHNLRHAWRRSGRTSPGEFWTFAPLGILPPAAFAAQVDWLKVDPWGIWKLAVVFILALPLLNAASRRLEDAGLNGDRAYYPFLPFVVLWLGYQILLWGGFLLSDLAAPYVLGAWILALVVLAPMHIAALFITIVITAATIEQLLLPSATPPPATPLPQGRANP
jgi:hypothetical protein